MTLIFYDWEFDADTNFPVVEPISLGVTAQDGREFYVINKDFDWYKCKSDWLKENVKPHLILPDVPYLEVPQDQIKRYFLNWLAAYTDKLESGKRLSLVGYYADYDHFCLSQSFGSMMQLPSTIPMWTRDIKQWCADLGDPQLPPQDYGEHNAQLDARWNKLAYDWLVENYDHPAWTPRLQKRKII